MSRSAAIMVTALSVALPSTALGGVAPVDVQYRNPVATPPPTAVQGATDNPSVQGNPVPSAEVTPTVAGEQATPTLVAETTSADTVAGLPFTGAELGMIALAGVLVGGAGLAVRRIARQDRDRSSSDVG